MPEPNSGCWLWTGSLTSRGYGQIGVGGRNWVAHRLAYTLYVGPIPDGLFACHRCDNRACVNPQHLFLGTKAQNSADMVAKGRQARGTRKHSARLNESLVVAIRCRRSEGASPTSIARSIGVSRKAVCDVVNRRTWRHVKVAGGQA